MSTLPIVDATQAPNAISVAARTEHRFRLTELLPWVAAVLVYILAADYLPLANQIVINILFVMSLDLVLGYAGIATLGHGVFLGIGAYAAGLLSVHGWHEPISGLLIAGCVAALAGAVSGAVVLRRTQRVTLLVLTLVVAMMVSEAANKLTSITGGADGLQGMELSPLLGMFSFDLQGRTAYLYSLVVLFLSWLVLRTIVYSSFGMSLTGIRENEARMHALGAPVYLKKLAAYTIGAGFAGISGALIAQTAQFVALDVTRFERSGTALIMLIAGGLGRLYGAFIGAPIFMIAQDWFAANDPIYWNAWIGVGMILIVTFARGGLLSVFISLRKKWMKP